MPHKLLAALRGLLIRLGLLRPGGLLRQLGVQPRQPPVGQLHVLGRLVPGRFRRRLSGLGLRQRPAGLVALLDGRLKFPDGHFGYRFLLAAHLMGHRDEIIPLLLRNRQQHQCLGRSQIRKRLRI